MVNIKSLLDSKQVIQWAINDSLYSPGIKQFAEGAVKAQSKFTQPRPKGYVQLATYIDKLKESKCVIDGVKIATVVLDSYTTMSEHLRRYLLACNDTTSLTLPMYGTVMSNYEILNNELLDLPCNKIFICHEMWEKDDVSGRISCKPMIEGQMRDKIGKDFEEIYFMEKKIVGTTAKYVMNTLGDSMRSCRTTRVLASEVEPDFCKIYNLK